MIETFTLALPDWNIGINAPNCTEIARISGEAEFNELVAVTNAYDCLVMPARTLEVWRIVVERVGIEKFVGEKEFGLLGHLMFISQVRVGHLE